MKTFKTTFKVICIPFMLIIKVIVGVFGLLVLLLTLTAYMTTGIIGSLISIASGITTAITLFGLGLAVYNQQYDQLFAISLILVMSAAVTALPFIAGMLLDKLGELGFSILDIIMRFMSATAGITKKYACSQFL